MSAAATPLPEVTFRDLRTHGSIWALT